jgi:hypothetical protein
MSDHKLRELERRLQQTLSVENEAAYLRARRDAGRLSAVRLQAAARLDYPPALMALDNTEPPSLEECLVSLGKEAVLRWGAALVRAGLPHWEATHVDLRPRAALAVVDRWIVGGPGEDRDQARSDAQQQIVALAGPAHAAAVGPNDDEGWVFRAVVALLAVVWESQRNLEAAFRQAMLVASGIPEPNALIEAAAMEFVPWLLGDRLHCLSDAP